MSTPIITPFVLGDFQTNCFVVTNPDDESAASDCWIVDCGFDPQPMFNHIESNALTPVALLLTHAHPDHIAGIDEARNRFGAMPMYIHKAEQGWCSDPMLNLSAMMGIEIRVTEPDHYLEDGDTLSLGNSTWEVLHTPGHSPGGVAFVHRPSQQAIVGDTLFAGSIGRFDFPSSDAADLKRSIHEVLLQLPDEMAIYPGHGPETTIGRERSSNPFILHGF